jgi:hypothetical protein
MYVSGRAPSTARAARWSGETADRNEVCCAAQRTGRSAARHSASVAQPKRPRLNATLYQRSIGTCCGVSSNRLLGGAPLSQAAMPYRSRREGSAA